MCAILDANVRDEVFGARTTPAGDRFLKWLMNGGWLVVGGKLKRELISNKPLLSTGIRRFRGSSKRELSGADTFSAWLRTAVQKGRIYEPPASEIKAAQTQLKRESRYRSNDVHVLALAKVSGAHLLYSNDFKLQQDFRSDDLLGPGARKNNRVYTTRNLPPDRLRQSHKRLLKRTDLCPRRDTARRPMRRPDRRA